MHSCGQLKLKRASLFSCRFWAHRTWCIPQVENWRIKHLCNMLLFLRLHNAITHRLSLFPGPTGKTAASGHSSGRRGRMGMRRSSRKSERRDWVEFPGWCDTIQECLDKGLFAANRCSRPAVVPSRSGWPAPWVACLNAPIHTRLCEQFNGSMMGLVRPWCLQQLDIRWNNQTLVDDSSRSLKRPKSSAPCTGCWPESGVGNDFKAWLEQIQEYDKWGHRGYIGENDRLAIRFTSPCEAFPSL